MYDALLFLHVLLAFVLVAGVVIYSAAALGAPAGRGLLIVGEALWGLGGLGVLVLGVWLVFDVNGYELWDGWVIAALVLWAVATELGRRAGLGLREASAGAAEGATVAVGAAHARLHWLRTLAVLALLVIMIYKPGA